MISGVLSFIGFIDVKEVMTVSMMRHHSEQDVLDEVEKSTSHRNTKRFDRKDENGKIFIRANFCRNFEPVSLMFISILAFLLTRLLVLRNQAMVIQILIHLSKPQTECLSSHLIVCNLACDMLPQTNSMFTLLHSERCDFRKVNSHVSVNA